MKKIINEGTYFYGSNPQSPMSYRLQLRFFDKINEAALRQALALTVQRYPYYMVRCISDGREYWLEPNSLPFELHHTAAPLVLGSEAVNHYLWAVSYQDDCLWLNVFHGLADGAASMQVLRTLAYYYCRERYDSALSPEGIRVGTEVPPSETWDPYAQMMSALADAQGAAPQGRPAAKEAPQPFNLFADERLHITSPVNHKLRIKQKDMMQYCRAQDGTPGVVTSLLLARAIDAVNPGNTLPVVTGVAMNLRPALDAPDYAGSPLGVAYLSYEGKIKEKPFTTQATGYRGRLILASDPDQQRQSIQAFCGLCRIMDSLPEVGMKKATAHKVLSARLGSTSFALSYMGPARLGAVEQYVTELRLLNEAGANAIMIEIMSSNGYFFLDFVQQWQEDIYFDAFCQQLALQGIPYEDDGAEAHQVPEVELP